MASKPASIPCGIDGARLTLQADGLYPAFVDGGYPVIYYTESGCTVCNKCASDYDNSDPATGADIYYEGPVAQCDDCGCLIESAYGDPDAQ